MRLRKATDAEYTFYARWRDIIFSVVYSGTRPTKEALEKRRYRRKIKKREPAKELTLKERQRLNKYRRRRKARKRLRYSIDEYKRKVGSKEITFIEEKGVVIGYVETRNSPKGYFRIVDWALSGDFQELDYMQTILEELKKKAKDRIIYILAPNFEGWSTDALTALGFHYERVEWRV
ncbi:MAG: hypothetical protein IKE91_02060 [Clostridia bacterium]|nr:hypothetical protein [Clostridia bacterium]